MYSNIYNKSKNLLFQLGTYLGPKLLLIIIKEQFFGTQQKVKISKKIGTCAIIICMWYTKNTKQQRDLLRFSVH